MNKTIVYLSSILLVSAAFAKSTPKIPVALQEDVTEVKNFLDVPKDLLPDLLAGNCPHLAIACEENTELPLKYFGNFDLFSIQFSPNLIFKVEKKFYLRFVKKNEKKNKARVYVSFDLKNWEKWDTLSSFQDTEPKFDIHLKDSSVVIESTLVPETKSANEWDLDEEM